MKDTTAIIIILHHINSDRCAHEQVYVNYKSELDARIIAHRMKTSLGALPANYFFEDSRFIPLDDLLRFNKWVEQPMT